MQCQIFTPAQIASLRKGGKILSGCLEHLRKEIKVGMTTKELDVIAETYITERGGKPAFKGYHGYPGTLCVSVNDEVVHGIPGKRIIMNGDVVSMDCGVIFDNLYTDACITVAVGTVDTTIEKFLETGAQTLADVVGSVIKSGIHVGVISSFIQQRMESEGYGVVRQLTGHGLGSQLHQFPDVPNWGKPDDGPVLPVHTLIAVEPIATMGGHEVKTDNDGWTIRTRDGSMACHFEHTVLITEGGCEVIA